MSANANFAATVNSSQVLINTANTNTNGTGTLGTVFTAGANGSRVDSIKIKGATAEGSTQAADTVRIFLFDGTNTYLFTEVLVAAGGGAVGTGVANFEQIVPMGITLKSGWLIKAAAHTTAPYNVSAFGGDF